MLCDIVNIQTIHAAMALQVVGMCYYWENNFMGNFVSNLSSSKETIAMAIKYGFIKKIKMRLRYILKEKFQILCIMYMDNSSVYWCTFRIPCYI